MRTDRVSNLPKVTQGRSDRARVGNEASPPDSILHTVAFSALLPAWQLGGGAMNKVVLR